MKLPIQPYLRICLFILFLYMACPASAQAQDSLARNNNLYSAGHAGAFVGSLYDAFYPYKQLEQHGDFGLGAPANLDGELMMLNGKYYQTRYTGITTQLADTGKTPYATVCFFKTDKVFKPNRPLTKAALFKYLDSVLNNPNGMYAIHISGNFKYLKTRAFPPVIQKPYIPIAAMLNRQVFFEFNDIKGDLIGFKLPEFMEGPAISGYHFHFISANKDKGGHVVDVIADNVTIEVEILNSFTLDVPQTADFKNHNFRKDNSADIKSAENGKK
jgi:acetolactate decarboxylase